MLTSTNKEQLEKAFNDYKALGGRKTSTMTEYELRLVDFFTRRYHTDVPGEPVVCVRRPTKYYMALLAYHDIITIEDSSDLSSIEVADIIEDKEVNFPPVRIHNSKYAMDVAFKSIFEDEYQPLRYFKDSGKKFNRINHTKARGFYLSTCANYMPKEDPYFDGELKVPKVESMDKYDELSLPIVLSEGQLDGDVFLYQGMEIPITGIMLPSTDAAAHISTQVSVAGILCGWSHLKMKAPTWVRAALAHANADLDDFLEFLGMELGPFNRDAEKKGRKTSNSKVAAISVALNRGPF